MNGFEEFIKMFGNVTILDLVKVVLIGLFLRGVYGQVKKYIHEKMQRQHVKAEDEKQQKLDIQEALVAVRKYPEYREQSIEIQKKLEDEITELKKMYEDTVERLNRMEETETRRERSKMRDTLLQNYRYYTNETTNPSRSWTKVESETFWELYAEYEAAGGNGHMHTDVAPEMRLLTVVETGVQRNN